MFLLMLAGAALTGPADASLVHQVQLPQGGTAAYHGAVTVDKRQVGMSHSTRPTTARCLWTATIDVSRTVSGSASPQADRLIDRSVLATGQRAGGCMETRRGIEADAARAIGQARRHLVTVASRDQANLTAELARPAGTALAAN